ncbi:response regulator transcription factor [Cupriavidus sp. CuC1]|jgi:two-component system KDP operon response regulator KdpE|uniref:response regulator transcription factor n=1 Tax=Cupriavidus sp. CuC1 TaxID=3373131 RepID=UPI0037D465F4
MHCVILIDDERSMQFILRRFLAGEGYQVFVAESGKEGIKLAGSRRPDVVLLDVRLPDMSAIRVIDEIRKWSSVPILAISGSDTEDDKIRLLDAGADGHLTKPFGMGELASRIRALLRRRFPELDAAPLRKKSRLQLDPFACVASIDEKTIAVTPREFRLLWLLSSSQGKVVPHGRLLSEVWGPSHQGDAHYLRVAIASLRKKLSQAGGQPHIIRTVPKLGYVLDQDKRQQ